MRVSGKMNMVLFAAFAVMMGSCVTDPNSPGLEYMPDMYRSPAIEAYVDYGMDTYHFGNEQADSLSNTLSARKPAPGSIAFVGGDMASLNMPYPFPNTVDGYEAAGLNLKSPIATNQMNIEKGKELYTIMCTHCHGKTGKGDGAISKNGLIMGIPDYSTKLKDLPEGKMYHSIQYGKNLMGSHASQLSQLERWQIIEYVKVLQAGGKMPEFDAAGNVMASTAAAAPADSTIIQ
jgi:mono/diheme cytochrome c family protein